MTRTRFIAICTALAVVAALGAAPHATASDDRSRSRCLTDGMRRFSSVPAGSGVNVLYDRRLRGHRRAAQRIATEVRTRIFPRFERLLRRRPPSDARERCFHGPDGRLDVYVTRAKAIGGLSVPANVAALVHPYDRGEPCAPRRPVVAVVRPDVRRAVLAHELFHAFQAAYDTAEGCMWYSPWEEATATWAGDWIYPRDDVEHAHRVVLERPEWPVWISGYAAWVFPRYLTEKFGAGTIRRIEEAKERHRPDLHVDAAIPGGFRERFPEFALYAFNQAPLPNVNGLGSSYGVWDRLDHKPKAQQSTLGLGGQRRAVTPLPVERMRVLSRVYRRIVVGDSKIRRLTFENPAADLGRFHVRALVRRADGAWTAENWDGRARVEFCRDDPAQDVRELVLVYANSGFDTNERVTAAPRLVAEESCATRFRVLAASLAVSTVASANSILCGTQSGRVRFDGSSGELPPDPGNAIELRDGDVSGGITARVPAIWTGHHLDGCRQVTGQGYQSCAVDIADRRPDGDGTWPISFAVSGRWDAPEWELRWRIDHPTVGFADAGDDECNVDIWGAFQGDTTVRRVPRASFLGEDPVTLTFSGSGRPAFIGNQLDATIGHSWSYAITFQRVTDGG